MDLNIAVELKEGLLRVTASGNFTLDAALRLLKEVCDTATEKQVDKILVNGLSMEGELPTLDRYQLGAEIAAYLKQHGMNHRLAIDGKAPSLNGFAVRVAENRGVTTAMFSSEQEALNWLSAWKG